MKKTEMITIDNAIISADNKSRYLEFYETIFDTINETYRCLYYLDGIKEFFGENYQPHGGKFKYFIKDTIYILKQKICLNIWKLLLDNDKDSLSIYKMKGYIYEAFNLIINVKGLAIDSKIEKDLRGTRTLFISHNLHSEIDYTVNIQELRPLLGNIYSYFQKLWIQNFVDDSLFISDGYFESLEKLYKDSVRDALKGIKP